MARSAYDARLMFFPIRTDRRLTSTPWVNYALIGLNLVIFALTMNQVAAADAISQRLYLEQISNAPNLLAIARLKEQLDQVPVLHYYLRPGETQLFQFISYGFLHANLMHLVGNMIFLFIFGNGVEDRLGKIGYLFFYLAGGVLAGLGHIATSGAPVLGASGAVAAVTGAYLALFPLSNVTIIYWFFFIGAFEVSSMLLILFRVAQDVVFQVLGIGNVAYMAHLAGYGFGFAVGMGLLLGRLLPREPYDMLALIQQKRRREQFRRLTRGGSYQPWDHAKAGAPASRTGAEPVTPEQTALMERRGRISAAINNHDLPTAARRYVELIEDHPDQVMAQQTQLDLANQLMADGWYDRAAAAYELFLKAYPTYTQRQQVQLILGLIHARYLEQPDRAKTLLTEALPRLDGEEKALAEQALAELNAPR